MENEKYKSYKMDETVHNVNVFHIYSKYRFLHISCKNCKLEDNCRNIKHKREICVVAKDAENRFNPFLYGHVSCFASDDFYICGKHQKSEVYIKKMVQILLEKYSKDQNVRS